MEPLGFMTMRLLFTIVRDVYAHDSCAQLYINGIGLARVTHVVILMFESNQVHTHAGGCRHSDWRCDQHLSLLYERADQRLLYGRAAPARVLDTPVKHGSRHGCRTLRRIGWVHPARR